MNAGERKNADKIKKAITKDWKASKAHPCLDWLINGKCSGSLTGCDAPPRHDHLSAWTDKESGDRILMSQPYGFFTEDLVETAKLCAEHGIKVSIDSRTSWWYPGNTVGIAYRKAK
jgi:hypothetical protein